MAAEDPAAEQYPTVAGKEKTYDITDTWCQYCLIVTCPITWAAVIPGVLGKKIITLGEEEVMMTTDCCLGCHSVSHRPYGELGSVEKATICCCVGFYSNMSPTTMEGGQRAIVPGNCCENSLVDEVVHELRFRMKARGDTGQIQRTEENLSEIKHLHAKVDAVMAHLNISAVPTPMEMADR